MIDQVLEIVARKTQIDPAKITPETRLLHDLGLYGDDADEVLLEIRERFHLDYAGFEFQEYFFPEGFAFGLMPRFIRRRLTAQKRPMTIAALARWVISGGWHTM